MEIPGYVQAVLEALVRILLPKIQAFFKSEEGQRELAEWNAQQGNDNPK